MSRAQFLEILRDQLTGQMHEGKVAAHVRYYEDYIQSQVRGGRSEEEILAELGDPRLIAKTLLDTDTDDGQSSYEEYSTYSGEGAGTGGRQNEKKKWWKKLDLTTWYGKAIVIAAAAVVVALLVMIIGAVLPFFIALAVILFIISQIKKRGGF